MFEERQVQENLPIRKRALQPRWTRKVAIGRNGAMINPVQDYLTKQLSQQTRKSYLSVLRSFVCDWLKQPEAFSSPETLIGVLTSIQPTDAAEYRDILLEDFQPATVAKKMSVLSGVYDHLLDAGLLPLGRNPWKIPRPKVSPDGKTAGFTRYEVECILAQPDIETRQGFRDYVMLLILFTTGIRKGELRQISTEDFKRQSGFMVLHPQYTKIPGATTAQPHGNS